MVSEKLCFKCKTVKPITDFYKHNRMADGHLNKCKDCVKSYEKEYREKNSEYLKAFDSARSSQPKRKNRPPRDISEHRKAWQKSNKKAVSCHNAVRRAVLSGYLTKPECCSRCGVRHESRLIHAHHKDYDKPMDVVWLCYSCHINEHRKNNCLFYPKRSKKGE